MPMERRKCKKVIKKQKRSKEKNFGERTQTYPPKIIQTPPNVKEDVITFPFVFIHRHYSCGYQD
jgi:hypothetical protein